MNFFEVKKNQNNNDKHSIASTSTRMNCLSFDWNETITEFEYHFFNQPVIRKTKLDMARAPAITAETIK